MNGYQIMCHTLRNRRHQGRPMHEWLIETTETLGSHGNTVVMVAQGCDHKGRGHSTYFVELADQPLEIKIAMRKDEASRLFELLEQENVNLFYVKTEVEFGTVGAAQAVAPSRSGGGPVSEPSHPP